MDNLNRILIKELEVLELGSKIQSQVQSEVGKNQREYFLREQLKAIQKELGEGDEQTKEIDELRAKIDSAGMPDTVKKETPRELDRISKMPVPAPAYTLPRTDYPGTPPRRVQEPRVHPRRDRQARLGLPRRSSLRAARGARS